MDLELATLSDMVDELRRRGTRFVMVAVEPSNQEKTPRMMHAAQGINARDMLSLVRVALQQVSNQGGEDDAPPPLWN
jgi:hypothetical protein